MCLHSESCVGSTCKNNCICVYYMNYIFDIICIYIHEADKTVSGQQLFWFGV